MNRLAYWQRRKSQNFHVYDGSLYVALMECQAIYKGLEKWKTTGALEVHCYNNNNNSVAILR
jgi:hypothetical protein